MAAMSGFVQEIGIQIATRSAMSRIWGADVKQPRKTKMFYTNPGKYSRRLLPLSAVDVRSK